MRASTAVTAPPQRSASFTSEWSPFAPSSLAVIGLLWSVIALVSTATTIATPFRSGAHPALLRTLGDAATTCFAMALITPLPLVAAQRWPLGVRFLPWAVHTFAFLVFWTTAAVLVDVMRTIAGRSAAEQGFRVLAMSLSFSALAAYATIAGIGHWVTTTRRVRRDRELQAELSAKLTTARLDALTAQLRPHFLFNALNTVSALIHEDPHAADRLVVQLGTLLRASLGRETESMVPLREELAFVRLFSDVMRVRLGGDVNTMWDVDPAANEVQVPKFLLLPLVENAFQHGIARATRPASMQITATRDRDDLVIRVRDSGPGVDITTMVENVGLGTTRERLRLMFGRDSLTIARGEHGGTVVTATIPA